MILFSEQNRDTIPFRHPAAGAACRPGVSISYGGAFHYLCLSAFICGEKILFFSEQWLLSTDKFLGLLLQGYAEFLDQVIRVVREFGLSQSRHT
jgi:hypothetical protein